MPKPWNRFGILPAYDCLHRGTWHTCASLRSGDVVLGSAGAAQERGSLSRMRPKGWRASLNGIAIIALLLTISLSMLRSPSGALAASAYAAGVLADNPISYWRLGETTGKI